MGQSNSTTIEPIKYSNECTNYMEWTNFKNLKKGEKYRLIIECYEFELIFCYYSFGGNYDYENCDAVFTDNKNYYTTDNYFEYYKFISKKEYKSKVRDKYNEKVLNIVLKQIINEEFNW
jgi:uncharacterized C2H2 Zn-finger protein